MWEDLVVEQIILIILSHIGYGLIRLWLIERIKCKNSSLGYSNDYHLKGFSQPYIFVNSTNPGNIQGNE